MKKKVLAIAMAVAATSLFAVSMAQAHSAWGMQNLPDPAIAYGDDYPDVPTAACCFCHYRLDVGPSNTCADLPAPTPGVSKASK